MNGFRLRLTFVLAILVVCSLAAHAPAWAQDGWSFVLTPQVWASHIAQNGLVAASSLPAPIFLGNQVFTDTFSARNSDPVDTLDPQWGLQLAAQKGRWTFAGSFQYVNFETRSDIFYTPSFGLPVGAPLGGVQLPNERVAQEFVNTTRMDMDFSASYLFADVVPNRLDLSLGAGFKFIYVSSSREYGNLSQFGASVATTPGASPADGRFPGQGLYAICKRDDCSDEHFSDRVKTKSWLYGATIPMSAIYHLTSDAKWLLPFSVTPFIGAETRDDQDVVYALTPNVTNLNPNAPNLFGPTVKRLDGTTFAYGVTGDATVRWIVNDTLSVYAGMRVQYINGHETYLAYGPLLGMSVRFGGK